MLNENKKPSVEYWNNTAKSWKDDAYSPDGNLTVFPSSEVRNKVVIKELINLGQQDAKILDIGCADGKLIRDMLHAGFTCVKGVDNSEKMITEAKKLLKEDFPDLNPDDIFSVGDADDLFVNEKFDHVTAIGLIEYVKDINDFFSTLYNLLNDEGIAFIESRNKLFNLISANDYTSNEENLPTLIKELDSIAHLSPIQEQAEVVLNTFREIGQGLEAATVETKFEKKSVIKYPFILPQYTPLEVIGFCEKSDLKVNSIVYYHAHPFAPKFGNGFTQLFNTIGILMQPLGYTPVGAILCSAFIARIEKNRES